MKVETGVLYVVATPIGNLEDITLRGLEVLRQVMAIYAEDTRVTGKLLARYEIKTPLRSYREAANRGQVEKMIAGVIDRLKKGESLAYVSDAGTPGVSDPGNFLVQRVSEAGFDISPIPGASALASLLSVSGFPVARPLFVGFLPKKKGQQTLLGKLRQGLIDEVYDSIVLYESPERIVKLLEILAAWELPLQICLGRELTKLHEEIMRGTAADILAQLKMRTAIKGEISLVITLS